MVVEQIWGSWKLLSFVYKAEDGACFFPYGKEANGIIIYDPKGYMSAVITRTDRPCVSTEDFGLLPDFEKIALAKGFMTYAGRYKMLEDRVFHNIEIGYFPNWVGTTFIRFPSFSNGNLVLATPPITLRDKKFTGYLVWQKTL